MNIKSELNWIQSELMKVKDPDLLAAIKSMLKYREKKTAKDAIDLSLDRANADKESGRTKPHQEIKNKYEKWL